MFFLNRDGTAITKFIIQRVLVRLKDKLDFPLYAHLLRHTFANTYIRYGKPEQLQKMLGHSRIDTTVR